MYGRLTRIEGTPAEINDGVQKFEQNVARPAREIAGNVGIVLMVNPEDGKGVGITYWADPLHKHEGKLNKNGRGFYFLDPSGHNMEVLTRAVTAG